MDATEQAVMNAVRQGARTVGEVMLDAEQIEEMMRAYNPDWWDDAKSLGEQP